jgi:hypothetical protein
MARSSARPRRRVENTTFPLLMYVATPSKPSASNSRRRSAIATRRFDPRLIARRKATDCGTAAVSGVA